MPLTDISAVGWDSYTSTIRFSDLVPPDGPGYAVRSEACVLWPRWSPSVVRIPIECAYQHPVCCHHKTHAVRCLTCCEVSRTKLIFRGESWLCRVVSRFSFLWASVSQCRSLHQLTKYSISESRALYLVSRQVNKVWRMRMRYMPGIEDPSGSLECTCFCSHFCAWIFWQSLASNLTQVMRCVF